MPYIIEQPYPMELVRDGDDILMRMEEYDTVRRIKMTSAAPSNAGATLLGDSRGRWDGETLVVTTTNIGYRWFNGTRHSARARCGDGGAVHAEQRRQPPRVHDDRHGSRDVHGARDVAQIVGVAARRADSAVRMSTVSFRVSR